MDPITQCVAGDRVSCRPAAPLRWCSCRWTRSADILESWRDDAVRPVVPGREHRSWTGAVVAARTPRSSSFGPILGFFPGVAACSTCAIEDAEERLSTPGENWRLPIRVRPSNSANQGSPDRAPTRCRPAEAITEVNTGGLEHSLCAECPCDPPPVTHPDCVGSDRLGPCLDCWRMAWRILSSPRAAGGRADPRHDLAHIERDRPGPEGSGRPLGVTRSTRDDDAGTKGQR